MLRGFFSRAAEPTVTWGFWESWLFLWKLGDLCCCEQRMLREEGLDARCARLGALVCGCASPCAWISWVSATLIMFVSERLPEALQTDLYGETASLGLWGRGGWGIVMRQQRGWECSTAIGQERRNGFKSQEGDFEQETSKSQWQELSVCWLSGGKQACYFGESLRITCLPGRTGERLVLGKEMTDGSLCPLQPSQLWLYIP